MPFYAVYKGFETGIFDNWKDCSRSIIGFSGAIYKKFNEKEDAQYFYKNGKERATNRPNKKIKTLDEFVNVETIKTNNKMQNLTFFKEEPKYMKLDKFCTQTIDSSDEDIETLKKKYENNKQCNENKKSKNKEKEVISQDPPIYVYTDGGCINNGKPNAIAGVGVYFGENDPRNVSRRFKGKQTNNTAEINAMIDVTEILKKEIKENRQIYIYYDSDYAMKACTSYGRKLASNGWQDKKPNLELVKKAYEAFKDKKNIIFKHVKAHTGRQDKHSLGNEGADRLASKAIGVGCSYKTKEQVKNRKYSDNIIFLNVKYENKDDAKKLGAKWNANKKKWYIMKDHKNYEILINKYKDK